MPRTRDGLWRPSNGLDARAAAVQARLPTGDPTVVEPADLPYRRVPCPACGHVTDDEGLVDVGAVDAATRARMGMHPTATHICASVCLDDLWRAGQSKAELWTLLGAPAEAIQRATRYDAGSPLRGVVRAAAIVRHPQLRVRLPLD